MQGVDRPISFGRKYLAVLSVIVVALAIFYVSGASTVTNAFAQVIVSRIHNEVIIEGRVLTQTKQPLSGVVIDVQLPNHQIEKAWTNKEGLFKLVLPGATRASYAIVWVNGKQQIAHTLNLIPPYWQAIQRAKGLWAAPKQGESHTAFESFLASKFSVAQNDIQFAKDGHAFIPWRFLTRPNVTASFALTVTKQFTLLGLQTFIY